MAFRDTESLTVYVDAYSMAFEIEQLLPNVNKKHRYTLGQDLSHASKRLLIQIHKANRRSDKVNALDVARDILQDVRIYLKLLTDLKQISIKQSARLMEMTVTVRKQLSAWEKSERKRRTKKLNPSGEKAEAAP